MNESNAKKSQDEDLTGDRFGPAKSARASFVITVWLEPQDSEVDMEWRWRVRHVQTGREAYFRRSADVLQFIGGQSELPPPQ